MSSWLRRLLGGRAPSDGLPAGLDPHLRALVVASGVFDADWYVFRYPDVGPFKAGPLAHFCLHGLPENRDPSPFVSIAAYLERVPEAKDAGQPAFLHALAHLEPEERAEAWMPDDTLSLEYLLVHGGVFDESWYLARNEDVGRSGVRPIDHFIRHGAPELRDPGPAFESEFYRHQHPDYAERSPTPVEHFVRWGRPAGYPGVGPPKYHRWISAFDELTAADVAWFAKATPAAPVSVFHVVDGGAVCLDRLCEAWDSQAGCTVEVRFVRGADVPDEAWSRLEGRAGGRIAAPGDIDGLAAGTVVLLAVGPLMLRPHAAAVLAQPLSASGALAAYCDHDLMDDAGQRSDPVFKPMMSPELMRHSAYAGSVIAALLDEPRRAALTSAVEAAVRGDGEVAWATHLLTLPLDRVARVPFILFHRLLATAKPRAMPGRSGEAEAAPRNLPTTTVVIPTRDRVELLRDCLESIATQTDYPAGLLSVVVVDNGSVEADTFAYFAKLRRQPNVVIVPSPGTFNFSKLCNVGAARARGDILVFLNNDMTVLRRDWLRRLVDHAVQPDVGVVGARLLYNDGKVQHAGVVLGVQGVAAHRMSGPDKLLPDAAEDVSREMVSMTGACLAVRRSVFVEVGGFDPILRVAFNDVKLCASIHQAGYRNIYVGEALLYHHESKSRGLDDSREKQLRNLREAIYVRERYQQLFRDDPSYSPNLSLQKIDDLANPPRVTRPWRRSEAGHRRVLLLSSTHLLGHGVATVVALQAAFLRERGWDVAIGGPIQRNENTYEGCRRVGLWTAEAAAVYAVAENIDCIVAHTPPFFSVARFTGADPLFYVFDHGEPPPNLFPDRLQREDIDLEKRFCAPFARRVFVISQAVHRHQYRNDAVVVRNGNSHLAQWSAEVAARRAATRKALGFEGCFVVLNACRFGAGERYYKGVTRYAEVASELPFRHPEVGDKVRFVLAGRGTEEDVAEVSAMGLTVFANITDAEMTDLYVASDLYLNLSQWEGYNLGIGQALAMGLGVVASDIEAHREFDIVLSDSVPDLCQAVAHAVAGWDEAARSRRALVEPWSVPLQLLAETLDADVAARDQP